MKKKENKENQTDLIQCGPHGWLRWHIICEHLMEDPTLEWVEFADPEGAPSAFTCPECAPTFVEMMDNCDVSKVRPACVECIKTIRRVFDPYFKEENEKEKDRPVQTL